MSIGKCGYESGCPDEASKSFVALNGKTTPLCDTHLHMVLGTAKVIGRRRKKESMAEVFECPGCGGSDNFIENWTATNYSIINWIDRDTGHIHWSGESILGDKIDSDGFECTNCHRTFTKRDFDPAARIADALAGLSELVGDDDD